MFLTTCYNHECFIINEHGSGATHCYGDEDFMGQCKRLARKVHKNTLELRMIMRWLLRVRHPDLAAWGKRRLISLWIYPQDLIEISRILSDFYRIWMSSLFEDIGSYSGNVLKNRGRSWMYDIFTYIGACGYIYIYISVFVFYSPWLHHPSEEKIHPTRHPFDHAQARKRILRSGPWENGRWGNLPRRTAEMAMGHGTLVPYLVNIKIDGIYGCE